ncbi:hypothetical protein GTA08_BOTSDO12125 [Neofusicoccum parvum]|uniref:Uncharacterized protein n=1 Tax=Neofusicoccum parvum TaxID=310453 RepID=A0ACB5S1C0_9PEZI|nr:hypothetical protein GTA08_BOTSDO12125 [Neofusicoccum parvum]
MKSFCALILCYLVAFTIASPFPLKPIEYPVCAEGVHIIIARASAEPPGQGIMGNVAQEVIDQVTGSDSIAVDYPASLHDYAESERKGVEALTQLINASYVDCPTSKMVLMGYAQGAQIVGDVLCGSAAFGTITPPLNRAWGEMISAVILMADPSHIANQTWNLGNSTRDGVFPYRNIEQCAWYETRTQSYCDNDDIACDSGNSFEVYSSYTRTYGKAAADFVVRRASQEGVP